jgi:hypothetical protein
MIKIVKIEVNKKDYFKIMSIIETYRTKGMEILSTDTNNKIRFCCNIFKLNKLIHDVELAKKLGLEVEMEIE